MERFSASRAAKHMACHASANLDKAIPGWQPPPETEFGGAAQAGTDVHEVVAKLIEIKAVTKSGTKKFNAKDMMAVGKMLTFIGEVWSQRRFTVLSEEEVTADWLGSKPTTTADLVFYTQDQLDIVDMKWGLIPVEVVENEQLLYYAASYAHLAPKAKHVTVHIAQPRADNMESWKISADRLAEFMRDARAADSAIQAGDVTFGVGDHCMFCPAYPHARTQRGTPLCPAAMDFLYPGQGVDEQAMLEEE